MAVITGTTTTDWSSVSLDLIDVQANFDEFATRFSDALLEILNGQFTVDPSSTATLLIMTLNSGGVLTFTGTGLDLNNPASRPIVKTFNYTNPITGDVVSLTGTLDFVGNEVVNSLTIGFPGAEQTIIGNLSVNPVSGAVSGSISQLQVTLGTTEMTIKGTFAVGGNFTVSGTVKEISVVDGTNTITMTGLALPYSALASVTTAADLFTVVGSQMSGNDTITYTNNSGTGMMFNGGGGNDIITINGPNGDMLDGGVGNDTLNGGAGNDTLIGNAGNDTLNGGADDDAMDGGAGNDTYVVDSVGDTVTESVAGAAGGVDLVQSAVDFTLGPNLENLTLTGPDPITGTGNGLNNILTGNSGNNALTGLAGNDSLLGGDGHDALDGGEGNDGLQGGNGNDTLDGGAGVDKLAGGVGDDTYRVDLVKVGTGATATVKLEDTITESLNQGTDTVILRGVVGDLVKATTLTVGANLEHLDASQTGATKLTLTGNTLNNQLTGNDADNALTGLAGNDTLNGGDGHDTLDGGLGQDTVNGGAGNDQITMLVTAGNVDTIDAGVDTDMLVLSGVVGGNGLVVVDLSQADQVVSIAGDLTRDTQVQTGFEGVNGALLGSALTVTGSTGDNTIIGSKGNDTLDGGAGDDTLVGGIGVDNLQGGTGDDLVLLGSVGEFAAGEIGETIDGGDGADIIRYTGTTAATLTLTNLVTNIEQVEIASAAGANTGTAAINVNAAAVTSNGITLIGNHGANVLTGTSQADTLRGNAGNDTLRGGLGNDSYEINRGDGRDTISDVDSTPGNSDQLLYGATINPIDLVLSRQVNDLRIALHGTSDQVTIQNWYTSSDNRVETIEAGNGQALLSSQVDQLIQAMAQFTTNTGLSWSAAAGGAGTQLQQAEFQNIIAAAWQ